MPRFQIIVRESDRQPLTVELGAPVTVGRSRRADIKVGDQEVGREQFRVGLDGDGPFVEGIGATNLPLVDGRSLEAGARLRLQHGSTIKVGRTVFEVEAIAATPDLHTMQGDYRPGRRPGPAPQPPTPPPQQPPPPPARPPEADLRTMPHVGPHAGRRALPPDEPPAEPPALDRTMPFVRPGQWPDRNDGGSQPSNQPSKHQPGKHQPSKAQPGEFDGGTVPLPPRPPAPARQPAPPPPPPPPPVARPAPPPPPAASPPRQTTTIAVAPEVDAGAFLSAPMTADVEQRLHEAMPRLFVKSEGMKRSMRLMRTCSVVGRGESANVMLPNESVSEAHAEIVFDGTYWSLRDRGSKNGTLVDGVQVRGTAQPLHRNSLLGFGSVRAVFLCNDPKRARADRGIEARAVWLLVANGRLGRQEAAEAIRLARADEQQSVADVLLMDTPLAPADWAKAVAVARTQTFGTRLLAFLRQLLPGRAAKAPPA
jgi:pSer/pThr/pTyr-binding forkhead associated (FHA) protein